MGTKYATTTAQQTLPDYLQNAYQGIVGKASGTASTPYNPYTGGFTSDQQTAFQNIGNLAGSANDNFGAASSALGAASNPAYNTVGNYMSPYNDAVVQATMRAMNNQNAEQQQGVIGNAIAKGAYGGNRVGVAQGELARQQDLANQQTIAGLYNQNYSQALGAAQNQQQVGLNAAAGYGNLGSTQMQTNLAQAGAQLGAGTQQQQFDFQQYLNAQAFPYQQQSWLASIAGGLAPSAGGTTTQQTPQGNIFSQILGAGLGVASMWPKKDGGRVHAASGGAMIPYANDNGGFPSYMSAGLGIPYANDNGGFQSYIPKVASVGGGGHGFPTIQDSQQQPDILSQYSDQMKTGADNIKNWFSPPNPTGLARGGVARLGYAGGGNIYDYANDTSDPNDPENWGASLADIYGGILKPSGGLVGNNPIPPVPVTDAATPIDGSRLGLGAGNGNSDLMAYAPPKIDPTNTPDDRGLNVSSLSLPPTYHPAAPNSGGVVPYSTGDQFTTTPADGYSKNIEDAFGSLVGGKGLNLSPDTKQALMAAGFGMMASKSPFALQGIGEGGLTGIQTWNARQALERENANQRASNAQTGAQIANIAEAAGLTRAQAQRETIGAATDQYAFQPTMAGMLVTNKVTPSASTLIPYAELQGWAQRNGVDPSTLPSGGQSPSAGPTPVHTEEGVRFTVEPPASAAPSGMSWTQAGQGIVAGQTTAALDESRKAANAAQDTTLQLAALKNAAANLPTSGALAPGSFAQERGSMAKTINTLAQMTGLAPPFDPMQVGSVEEMNKLTTQFGFSLARTTGSDVAASVVSQGVSAVPGIENSPQGFRTITGLIQESLNRTRDYNDYLNKWASKTGGDLTGAAEYFNKIAPPSLYANAAILSSAVVPKTQSDIDSAPAGTLFNIDGQLMVK